MKVMAFKRISVLNAAGLPDAKSYIAAGDLCTVGEKTATGLWPVTYPTSKGSKTRWVRTLKGFLCNQNEYADISYAAPRLFEGHHQKRRLRRLCRCKRGWRSGR